MLKSSLDEDSVASLPVGGSGCGTSEAVVDDGVLGSLCGGTEALSSTVAANVVAVSVDGSLWACVVTCVKPSDERVPMMRISVAPPLEPTVWILLVSLI